MSDVISFLSSLPLFQGVAYDVLPNVLQALSAYQVSYQKGEYLLHNQDVVSAAGLVLEGKVLILREDFWGNRAILTQISAGYLFGETYAMLHLPAEVSVEAAEDTTVLYLNLQALLTAQDPTLILLSHRLMQSFARRNLTLTRKIAHVTCRTTREKLLSYLSAQASDAGDAVFSIPFNRQQLADYLAVERSAMCAELSRMKQDGLLDYHKNHFRLFLQ